jgi:UDP-GlcNAc:undecaprenyl-phosphate GlcNAc-1-phosphate transferase
MIKIFLFFFLINFIFIYYFDLISKFLNVYDFPDKKRKFHGKKISLLGGAIILANLFFLILIMIFNFSTLTFFIDNKYLVSFFLPIFLIFSIGLYDDKFNLTPYVKFFLIVIVLILITYLDRDLLIKEIYIKTLNLSFSLGAFSLFFTILCILLFINALNMFDGINLQVGFYSLIVILFFILNKIFFHLSFFLLFPIVTFLYLNFCNKTFLGDSGTYILGFIISYIIIKQYNYSSEKISIEEIFTLMMIPGIDMLRLFIQRLSKLNNPFVADRNHIHHLLQQNLEPKYVFCIIQLLIFLPIILMSISPLLSIITGVSFYSLILLKIIK